MLLFIFKRPTQNDTNPSAATEYWPKRNMCSGGGWLMTVTDAVELLRRRFARFSQKCQTSPLTRTHRLSTTAFPTTFLTPFVPSKGHREGRAVWINSAPGDKLNLLPKSINILCLF